MARTMTKTSACQKVAKSLREFGYLGCTAEMIRECLDSWITGKRDLDLPHGIIGAFASRQFDEIEDAYPGLLAKLTG